MRQARVRVLRLAGDLTNENGFYPRRQRKLRVCRRQLDFSDNDVRVAKVVDLPGAIAVGNVIPTLLHAATTRQPPEPSKLLLVDLFFDSRALQADADPDSAIK